MAGMGGGIRGVSNSRRRGGVVRKNTVVWRLNVGAHPSTSKRFPKAQALAELKRYAVKQKAHAGSG